MTKLDQIEHQFQVEWNYREPANIPQTGAREVEACAVVVGVRADGTEILCGCPVAATDEARRGHWERIHRGQRRTTR